MKKVIAELAVLPIATRYGDFIAHYSERGLCALDFPRRGKRAPAGPPATGRVAVWHRLTSAALDIALQGKTPPKLPPLDPSAGTPFQQQVWRVLKSIRRGRTMSYSEVARAIGRPAAARAVGTACGANPLPVFVPCHRVVASGGKLGGFSGGLDWKQKLLGSENAVIIRSLQ